METEKINQNLANENDEKHISEMTKDLIVKLKVKYNVGIRPLSIVLNFGEMTLSRYQRQEFVPKIETLDFLREIYESADLYLEYLESNKDNIAKIAYSKSRKAVDDILKINQINDEMLEKVSKYIVNRNFDITNLSLQKILYYVQLFYYMFTKEFLFKSECNAWKHGPVFGSIYAEYKKCGSEVIREENSIELEPDVKKIVDEVLKDFAVYTAPVLVFFTHCEKPWKESYQSDKNNISNESLIELSNSIQKSFNIKKVSDIKKYSDSMISKFREWE